MTTTPGDGALRSDAVATRVAQIGKTAERDLPKAMKLAARAKAEGVRSPLVHHLVALSLKDSGQFDEAIVELGLGLELAPHDPRLMETVGFCLLELNRRQEAAHVFERAMKLDPNSAEAAYGYGWSAEQLGALPSAESAFARAVKLNPDHADALAGLSGLAVRRRDWTRARDLAERAASLTARQTDAPMNLARIDLGVGEFDSARARVEALLRLPYLKPLARANTHILLGDALDGLGRFPEAFDAYARGKTELDVLFASEFGGPERHRSPEVVGAMVAEFMETPADNWAQLPYPAAPTSERGHAFLLGFPRSGTTLLEQVIATHPDMVALGERPVMIDAESEFVSRAGGMHRLAGVLSDLLEPFRDSYWRRVRNFGVDPAGKVFVDKHPLSTMRIPLMYKMFPEAKFIFALRDPRDVVLSCFRRSFNMNANMYEFNSVFGAARFYDAVMKAGEAYLERLPVKVHQVRHEDMVADFDAAAGALCDFLAVEWTPILRQFASTERTIATPSGAQIAKGLNAEGVGHWRNYAFALEPVATILGPWIEKFGYPPA
jgi:Flp pilus assembly protein TadD